MTYSVCQKLSQRSIFDILTSYSFKVGHICLNNDRNMKGSFIRKKVGLIGANDCGEDELNPIYNDFGDDFVKCVAPAMGCILNRNLVCGVETFIPDKFFDIS